MENEDKGLKGMLKRGRKKKAAPNNAKNDNEKTVYIVEVNEKQEPKEPMMRSIIVGTKGWDVKKHTKLDKTLTLYRAKDKKVLPDNADIFNLVEDGDKILAMPDATIGAEVI